MNISPEEFEKIASEIQDETSPVGIDAKKTHIFILHKLNQLQQQLDRLEQQVTDNAAKTHSQ